MPDSIDIAWRKSSYSGPNNNCVEVGIWQTSTYSGAGNNCVEVAAATGSTVLVRDSKNPKGGRLAFTADEWQAFTAGVRRGAFTL